MFINEPEKTLWDQLVYAFAHSGTEMTGAQIVAQADAIIDARRERIFPKNVSPAETSITPKRRGK